MELELLEKERFNSMKELSDVQIALSDARVSLDNLRDEKETYLILREEEAVKRVEKVLESMKDVFLNIDKNTEIFKKFKIELDALSENAMKISEGVSAYSKEFIARIDEQDQYLKDKIEFFSDTSKSLSEERTAIEDMRNEVHAKMIQLDDDFRLLNDRRGIFDRAWAELENKKNK